jgi:ACS family tartrate transporter-like MFS transporter
MSEMSLASAVHSPANPEAIGRSAQRKAGLRLLPLLAIGYGMAYVDRVNIGFASLQMNRDLHFSATVYGLGAGLFYIGYALCEVPSNMLLLRFGARLWLTRIMLTWGLISAATMFVRTPFEFNLVRLLLGAAEAGFFPGVVYYLTLWFPTSMRARAVSRFYVALPLSSVVMGALAGWLLGLNGKLGLAGWQWLFLLEGLPPVAFSLVIFKLLPDSPGCSTWLTEDEKAWLEARLQADSAAAHLGYRAGVREALLSSKVWMIGGFLFCALTIGHAYVFSAPAILKGATGWSVTQVGFLVAGFGLAGAASMLLNSMHSDRTGERALHCIVPCLIICAGFVVAGTTRLPWLLVLSMGICFVAYNALLGPAFSVPMQFLAGKAAAAGIAAANSIAMLSGFIGPYYMGVMRDATGSYQAGLLGLVAPCLGGVSAMIALTISLRRYASGLPAPFTP